MQQGHNIIQTRPRTKVTIFIVKHKYLIIHERYITFILFNYTDLGNYMWSKLYTKFQISIILS